MVLCVYVCAQWKDGHGGSGETRRAALDPTQHTCVWEEAFDMELK
jgi:hypothetical protein